jgi:hypothetical protein
MLVAAACQSRTADYGPKQGGEAIAGPHYTILGEIDKPGPRPLTAGETVSQAVHAATPIGSAKYPMTITLKHRGPEGFTRHVIDFNAAGTVVDPTKDIAISDGDELDFPTPAGQAPSPATAPAVGYR